MDAYCKVYMLWALRILIGLAARDKNTHHQKLSKQKEGE